jgi:predicted dehydrogenase
MLAVMYKLSVVCNALLQEDSPPPVDPADPLITLRIIEAAQQSARDGNVVKLVS